MCWRASFSLPWQNKACPTVLWPNPVREELHVSCAHSESQSSGDHTSNTDNDASYWRRVSSGPYQLVAALVFKLGGQPVSARSKANIKRLERNGLPKWQSRLFLFAALPRDVRGRGRLWVDAVEK